MASFPDTLADRYRTFHALGYTARDRLLTENKHKDPDALIPALERAGIINSLQNLQSFPDIQEREAAGALSLHGTHFDIESGTLSILDEQTGQFNALPTGNIVAERRKSF